MILESAQMLSTAHRVLDGVPLQVTYKTNDKVVKTGDVEVIKPGKLRNKKVWVLGDSRNDVLYNATHINHPSNVWIRESVENYLWLVDHMFALGAEYTHRYGKKHKTLTNLGYILQSPPFGLKDWEMTKIPCCMPESCIISDDPVLNYQEFYRKEKSRMHKWTNRTPPPWINGETQ